MKYSAPLDGIRAVAILAVFVFHVCPAALRGGFVGVDVFFVLSGFLITSIILHDVRDGSFTLREFYARRIQRLLPNAVAAITGTVLLWTLLTPFLGSDVAHHATWALANLSNVYIWRTVGGYWGDAAASSPLLHTWSLAIEEQFYLLYPASLVLLARVSRRARFARGGVWPWLAGAAALSFAASLAGSSTHATATFYMLPTRAWELLLGAVLAARRIPLVEGPETEGRAWPAWCRQTAGLVGLALVLAGCVAIGENTVFPGWVALLPTLGTALMLEGIADERSLLARLLARPFMVGTGRVSYSLYLWHWPLITMGRLQAGLLGVDELTGACLGALASCVLAVAAYFLVERPLRNRGAGRARRLAFIGSGFACAFAALFYAGSAAPHVATAAQAPFDPPEFRGLAYSAGRVPKPDPSTFAYRYHDVRFAPMAPREGTWATGGVRHAWGHGASPDVVVLGSSHALMYANLIDGICRERGLSVAFLAADQTPVFFNATVNDIFPNPREARAFDAARRQWLRAWHPRVVVVVDRWDTRVGPDLDFRGALRGFLSEVAPLAGRVVLVAQVPVVGGNPTINLREYAAWQDGAGRGDRSPSPDPKEPLRRQALATLAAAAREFPNVELLRADRAFYNKDGSVRWKSGRIFYYADSDHLSEAGAAQVRNLFEQALTR